MIKFIHIADGPGPKFRCHEIVKISVHFLEECDIPTKHGFTHWPEIGQIFYDWQHKANNFFEISIFDEQEAGRIEKKWNEENEFTQFMT